MPELPYAPFYFSDWLGDTKVRRMSYEERGIYFELLAHSWQEPIPADPDELAHLLGITRRRLDAIWKRVGKCWEPNENGGLVNPRLERERRKLARRKVPISMRRLVIERDGLVCGLCGTEVAAGPTELGNLQVAHGRCNRAKGARR